VSKFDDAEELERQCRVAVDQLIARYQWRLLERAEFVARTRGHLRAGGAAQPLSAAIGVYCAALHAACSGAEGPPRQNQAYGELAHYLHSMTSLRFADLPPSVREDVTQSALERVFRSFDRCRAPIAFLAFAGQHLLDAVRVARRREYHPSISLEQALGGETAGPGGEPQDDQPAPLERVIAAEQRAAVERLLEEFASAHPRAAKQAAVLRLAWIEQLDDAAIGQLLSMSLNSVYVARSRIIRTLQTESHWKLRAADLGISLDEL